MNKEQQNWRTAWWVLRKMTVGVLFLECTERTVALESGRVYRWPHFLYLIA